MGRPARRLAAPGQIPFVAEAVGNNPFIHSYTKIIADQVEVRFPALHDALDLGSFLLVVRKPIAGDYILRHIVQPYPRILTCLLLRVAQNQIPRDNLFVATRRLDTPFPVVRADIVTDDIVMISTSGDPADSR